MRKISRRSFLKAATVACALTALTACGGGDESAAVSVAKDENVIKAYLGDEYVAS